MSTKFPINPEEKLIACLEALEADRERYLAELRQSEEYQRGAAPALLQQSHAERHKPRTTPSEELDSLLRAEPKTSLLQ
jgi:hypothetical protein